MTGEPAHDIALVMGGGGARAAYQVGVLRSIARRHPDLRFPILTGVSAGSINAAFLGNSTRDFREGIEDLIELWGRITTEEVFRTDPLALMRTTCRWGLKSITGGRDLTPPPRGFVDTSPLRKFLRKALSAPDGQLTGIRENLRAGRLKALAVTTTDYSTSQTVTHVQSCGVEMWTRPHRISVETQLGIDHVMASCALPLFFPAVKIGTSWHGDGGVGLTAPLSPALHLGACRILAVSTRFEPGPDAPEVPPTPGYPPAAQVCGLLLSAVFLDMLDNDAANLDRINRLLAALPEQDHMGLRSAGLLLLRPSQNLATVASRFETCLPQPFRFLLRGTGTREARSPEALSMVMFEPEFIQAAIELGEADGDTRHEEIAAFLAGENLPGMRDLGCLRVG